MTNSSYPSFGMRLVRWVAVRQQRRADQKISAALATFPTRYRDGYVMELERRLAGQ